MIKVTGLQKKMFLYWIWSSYYFHKLSQSSCKNYQNYETTKTKRKGTCLQLQETLPWRERFKSDWTLDVQSHWWHRTWFIAPVCGQHAGLGVCWWISTSSISMKESMCPELHCTFHLEYCCVDHQVKKTVPGLHSCAISSAVVLAEQREGFERDIDGCDYPRFYLPYGSLWRRGNPSCWFD